MASGVLVLGSDQEEIKTCQRELASLGYGAIVTTDREKARELLKSERLSLLFSDILWLSGTAGSELLRYALDLDREVSVIVLTSIAAIEAAVEALAKGASFYLLKPFTTPQSLLAKLSSARAMPCSGYWTSRRKLQPRTSTSSFPASPARERSCSQGQSMPAADRSRGSFVPVDCASLPEALLEAIIGTTIYYSSDFVAPVRLIHGYVGAHYIECSPR